jgi:hypothetical protein
LIVAISFGNKSMIKKKKKNNFIFDGF